MIVNNRFLEFWQILTTFLPFEVLIIFLGGLSYYIITILIGDTNVKKGRK